MMLVQLVCKNCSSNLKEESGQKTFICESCGSRYVFADEDEEEIIDVKALIAEGKKALIEGDFDSALDNFELYIDECGLPDYEAYLGYILSRFECRTIKQLSKVAYDEAFEIPEWKTLVEIAGEHKGELLTAKAESVECFKKKMQTHASRQDAEIINAKALYLMYVAEFRGLEDASGIKGIAGKDEFFDTLHGYYIIPCTEKDKTAEFYLPAIKKACRFGHNEVVIIIPEPSESMKDEFLEEMYEYHMSNNIGLVLVFIDDLELIKRIYRYSNKMNCNANYDVPDAHYCDTEAYLQGNQLILIGGNKKDADTDPVAARRESEEGLKQSTEKLIRTSEERKREQERESGVNSGDTNDEEMARKEKEAEIEQRAAWIRTKKCRHCGGEFIGRLFSKTCSSCGKRKDY